MTTSNKYGITELAETQTQRYATVNDAIAILETMASSVIIEQAPLNTPPGSPAEGDTYIVGTAPTGAWASNADDIATYYNTGWLFITAPNGSLAYAKDTTFSYRLSAGVWTQVGVSTGTSPPQSPPTQLGEIYIDTANDVAYIGLDLGTQSPESDSWARVGSGSGSLSVTSSSSPPQSPPFALGDIHIDTAAEISYIGVNLGTQSPESDSWQMVGSGSGSGGGVTVTSGSGAPVSTPAALGDIYIDTLNDQSYTAVGIASSDDWNLDATATFSSNKPPFQGARARLSSDVTTVDTTGGYVVATNTVDYDTDSFHATAGRLTIPSGLGIRKVSLTAQVMVDLSTAATWSNVAIRHYDSSDTELFNYTNGRYDAVSGFKFVAASSGVVEVSDGDYFTFTYWEESDTSITVAANYLDYPTYMDLVVVESAGDYTTITPVPAFMGASYKLAADVTTLDMVSGYNILLDTANFDTNSFTATANRLTIPVGLGIRKVSLFGQIAINTSTASTHFSAKIFHYNSSDTEIAQYTNTLIDYGSSSRRAQVSSGLVEVSEGDYFILWGSEESDNSVTLIGAGTTSTYMTLKVDEVEGGQWVKSVSEITTAEHTLGTSEMGSLLQFNSGSAQTLFVPHSDVVSFPIGTSVDFTQWGAGQLTIAEDSPVTIWGPHGFSTKGQFEKGTLFHVELDTWLLTLEPRQNYDIAGFSQAVPAVSAEIAKVVIPSNIDVLFEADFAGSAGDANTGSDSSPAYEIDVQDDGVSIGTVSIDATGATSFTTISGTSKTVLGGSVVKCIGSAIADTTVDGIAFTLKGYVI